MKIQLAVAGTVDHDSFAIKTARKDFNAKRAVFRKLRDELDALGAKLAKEAKSDYKGANVRFIDGQDARRHRRTVSKNADYRKLEAKRDEAHKIYLAAADHLKKLVNVKLERGRTERKRTLDELRTRIKKDD